MNSEDSMVPIERVAAQIYRVRGENIMLDSDLAALYTVETAQLVRAMKRNGDRFPSDFAFQLTAAEFEDLKCQLGISTWGGRRYAPWAFTEHGVAMLSAVLRGKQATLISLAIVKAFVKLRRLLATNEDLARKVAQHDHEIGILFDHVRALIEEPVTTQKKPIGFKSPP